MKICKDCGHEIEAFVQMCPSGGTCAPRTTPLEALKQVLPVLKNQSVWAYQLAKEVIDEATDE